MVLADLGRSINKALGAVRSEDLDDKAVDDTLNEISVALLKHDVGLAQVARLKNNVRKAALGGTFSPAVRKRVLQKAVFDGLVELVDAGQEPFKLKKGKVNVLMLVGLQGAGKTTTCTKLATYYQRRGFRVGLVCADTFRAGAFDQLKQNATRARIAYFGSYTEPDPAKVARAGVEKFKKDGFNLIIVDTSGRHQQEQELFNEMVDIGEAVRPDQTLLVMDASIGRAAEPQAKAFKDASNFGAIVLTKMDGHAKGGGAIAAVAATHTSIAFIGTGEHITDLEPFAPQQFVSRLLGIGDIQGLMEHVQSLNLNQKETMKNLQRGVFTLRDLRAQINNIMKMGPLQKVASMVPGLSNIADQLGGEDSHQRVRKMICILDSMTEKELDGDAQLFWKEPTRCVRVARGSGASVREVEEVLNQQEIMSRMAKGLGGQNGVMSQLKKMQQTRQGQAQLDAARQRLRGAGMGPGSFPDMSQLMGAGGVGGLPDIANMFGPGGMPDMSQMMNFVNGNPMLKNMMKQFGGGS